jgi:adenylate kinase
MPRKRQLCIFSELEKGGCDSRKADSICVDKKIEQLKRQILKSMRSHNRPLPNILVTGTPGTGKSRLSLQLSQKMPFKLFPISELVKKRGWYEEYDATFDTYIINEDKMLSELEPELKNGGCIVDFHGCDVFGSHIFDLAIVLRVSTEVLYDRLKER